MAPQCECLGQGQNSRMLLINPPELTWGASTRFSSESTLRLQRKPISPKDAECAVRPRVCHVTVVIGYLKTSHKYRVDNVFMLSTSNSKFPREYIRRNRSTPPIPEFQRRWECGTVALPRSPGEWPCTPICSQPGPLFPGLRYGDIFRFLRPSFA